MHTPNQGLTYMFKFSAVLIICSLYECSLPSIPFPLLPSRFSLPSFPARSSQWRLWLTWVPSTAKSVRSLPSFSLPTVPCPLSLFSIMFLLTFHPWWTYVPYTNCWNYNLCIKWLSEQNRQLLSMHKLCPSSYIHFQCKRVSNFGLVNSWKSSFNKRGRALMRKSAPPVSKFLKEPF